jgi:dTDP-4-amino-4,6-dideoxygalactose transaminase
VHLAGKRLRSDGDQEDRRRHKLWLIEDCGQAHGCTYDGQARRLVRAVRLLQLQRVQAHLLRRRRRSPVTSDEKLATSCGSHRQGLQPRPNSPGGTRRFSAPTTA